MSNDFGNMNPYQATTPVPGVVVGDTKKPTSMVVFGILNLVFGVFGILGLLFAVFSAFLDLPQDPNNPLQAYMNDPTLKTLMLVSQVFASILAVLLVISGVGLINGKLFGRRLAIIYAIGTMLLVVIVAVINISFISLPVLAHASELPEGPEKIGAIIGGSAFFIQPICGFIYPVLLLIFMMRAPVKNYFRI